MKNLNIYLLLFLMLTVAIQLCNVLDLYEFSDTVIRMNGIGMVLGVMLLVYTTVRRKQKESQHS